jgi:hypothetical protein
MPIVANASAAQDFARGHGLNDMVRRLSLPGFPPGECIGGYVFFPGGTGPFMPIFCEPFLALRTIAGGVGTDFVRKSGGAFATAVAELAGISLDEAKAAVARAAGLEPKRLDELSVLDVGRKIFEAALPKAKVQHVRPACDSTVGEYLDALARLSGEIDAGATLKALACQAGLTPARLRRLPLSRLADHFDSVGTEPMGSVARSSGTLFCVTGGGQTSCTILTGWQEGALWGGFIGGVIGGGVGAAIGAVIGAIIGWLF